MSIATALGAVCSFLGTVPILCPEAAVIYLYLFTRANKDTPTQLFLNNDIILNGSNINFTKPTKIYVTGLFGTYQTPDSQDIKNAFLATEDCNFISVDASQFLTGVNLNTGIYYDATPVGELLAEFIDYLITKGLKLSDLELIGVSLGSHVIGIAGSRIKTGKPAKIFSFDPAGFTYDTYPPEKRLDKTDADLVIVIHTDPGGWGYNKACGHIDFWINSNRTVQPGCTWPEAIARRATEITDYFVCNHSYSFHVGTYCIYHPKAYPARKCDSSEDYVKGLCDNNDLQYVSDQITSTGQGNYYATTGDEAYSIG